MRNLLGLLINVFVALFVNVVHFSLFREAAGLISQRTQVNTAVTVHKKIIILLNLLLQSLQITCRDIYPFHYFCL